jgi:hypothetical protein
MASTLAAAPACRQSAARLPGRSKNLVIVRAGDSSLHEGWLCGPEARDWDIVVSYFGDDPERYRSDDVVRGVVRGVVRIDAKGAKWPALHELVRDLGSELEAYDFIWFPDDDLATDKETVNRMFALCARFQLQLAQPALSLDSYLSHAITLRNTSFLVRFTNFVEIMAPVFRRDFLVRCAESFGENRSGWGLDVLWPTWVAEQRAIGIIDACVIKHTRPVGGPNYQAMKAGGISAKEELLEVLKKYNLSLSPQIAVTGGIDCNGRELLLANGHGIEVAELLLRGYLPRLEAHPDIIVQVLRPVLRQMVLPQETDSPVSSQREFARTTAIGRVASQFMNEGNYAAASILLASALAEGEAGPLWNDWATVEYRRGNAIRAERGFRRALQLDCSLRQAAVNLTALLLSQARTDEALSVITPHIPALDAGEKRAIHDLLVHASQQQSSERNG